MKQSEINIMIKNCIENSKDMNHISVADDDAHFSHSGCRFCESLPCDVYNISYLLKSDMDLKIFDNVIEDECCGDCLCLLINGEVDQFHFHVDIQDCEAYKGE